MKDYQRRTPLFSLCGLNCGLCTMYIGGYCPGCGGGAGHQPCAVIRCSRDHGGVEYCFQCSDYPCGRLRDFTAYDSFITHQGLLRDLEEAKRIGLDAYLAGQAEKRAMLQELLDHYNDGRKKALFCTAVNLLPLDDLREILQTLAESTALAALPEKSAHAAALLRQAAAARDIELHLRRKK